MLISTRKTVSILIPAYNAEKTIARALDSILLQGYPLEFIKIIVVNDGSKDNTLQILRNYEAMYVDTITVLTQKNMGLAYTRQKLINYVTTDYFLHLDADDYYTPGSIKKFMDACNDGEYDIVCARSNRLCNGKQHIWWLTSHITQNINTYLKLNQLFSWNVLFKTLTFKNSNITFDKEISFMEDNVSVTLFFMNKNLKFKMIKDITYVFIQNDNSMSDCKTSRLKNYYNTIKAIDHFLKIVSTNPLYQREEVSFAIKNFLYITYMYFMCMFFLFPATYRYKKPKNEVAKEAIKTYKKTLAKYNFKLTMPIGYWRKISYIVCCKTTLFIKAYYYLKKLFCFFIRKKISKK